MSLSKNFNIYRPTKYMKKHNKSIKNDPGYYYSMRIYVGFSIFNMNKLENILKQHVINGLGAVTYQTSNILTEYFLQYGRKSINNFYSSYQNKGYNKRTFQLYNIFDVQQKGGSMLFNDKYKFWLRVGFLNTVKIKPLIVRSVKSDAFGRKKLSLNEYANFKNQRVSRQVLFALTEGVPNKNNPARLGQLRTLKEIDMNEAQNILDNIIFDNEFWSIINGINIDKNNLSLNGRKLLDNSKILPRKTYMHTDYDRHNSLDIFNQEYFGYNK